MPTYEYRCSGCGKNFSVALGIREHETARVSCPKCGSKDVVQKISRFGVKTSRKS